MAQNIIKVLYVFMQDGGHLQTPPEQRYELPPSSLIGTIGMRRRKPDGPRISPNKMNMGFTVGKPSEDLYKAWRKCVKDLMTARNFVLLNNKPASYPDADYLPI